MLLIPAVLLPNPQDAVIALNRQVREEAQRQAQRIDDVAKDLGTKGVDANDPRTRLSEELRQLAERLRSNPDDLDMNLSQLGSIEDQVRAQLGVARLARGAGTAGARPLAHARPRHRQVAFVR